MALRVSTVNADVFLYDLGTIITHPTTSRDLSLEFSAIELKASTSLTEAIQGGTLLADDGIYTIHAEDYDPDETLIQQLGYKIDSLYVSEAELASKGDIYLKPSLFPLTLNSTATTSRNVYCPSARWITWELAPNDKIVLSGCSAAGIYTVQSVLDQQNFIVNESIVDSTGGFIAVFHPAAPKRIGVDDTTFSHVSGDTLQAALESIDDQIGLGGGMDFNRMVLETTGDLVYIDEGDIVIIDYPLPRPVLGV